MKRLLLLSFLIYTTVALSQTMPGMPMPEDSSMTLDSVTVSQDTTLRKDLRTDPALLKWKRMIVDSVTQSYQDSLQMLRDSLASMGSSGRSPAEDAVYDRFLEERYFSFLKAISETKQEKVLFGLFSRANPELEEYRINEMKQYLHIFPPSARHDQVLVFLGDSYLRSRQPALALSAYLKQVSVFPNSPAFSETQSKIIKLVSDDVTLRNNKTTIIGYLNNGVIDEGYQQNYFRYLRLLSRIQTPEMSPWYFDEMHNYLSEFPHAGHNDKVLLWIADMHESLHKYESASYVYQKLQVLYPQSDHLADTYLRLAEIYRNQLKDYEKAANAFTQLAREFPGDSLAVPARVAAAKVYADNLGQYQKAIEEYQKIIDNYPESPRAIDAMFAQAELYLNQTDEPAKAVERYIAVTETYPDFKEQSGTAFRNAADIYAGDIKDYVTAVDMYMKFAQRYPNHKSVPERLEEAADIAEDELDDYLTAIDLLELARKKYPDSNAAKTAERKLPKLREKAQQPSGE